MNASNTLFVCGTVAALIGFATAVAENFTSDKVKSILNKVTIGCILVAAACYVAYDVIK